MVSRDGSSQFDPEYDYIKQQIRNFLLFLRRLAAQAETQQQIDLSLDALRGSVSEHLGIPHGTLEALAPSTAAALLRDPQKLHGYAAVCATEAELLYRRGELKRADAQSARAIVLYREVLARLPGDQEAERALRALSREASDLPLYVDS